MHTEKYYEFPEVAVRLVKLPSPKLREPVDSPQKATDYLCATLSTHTVETIAVVMVNSSLQPLSYAIAGIGTTSFSCFSTAEISRLAILSNATGLIIYHNHPSKDPAPSHLDDIAAKKIWVCLELFDITLHDFIIIGDESHYYSYSQEGREPFQTEETEIFSTKVGT